MKTHQFLRACFLLFLMSGSYNSVSAEEGPTKLEEVNTQIEELQKNADILIAKQTETEAEYKKLQSSIKSLNDKVATLAKELGRVKTSQAEAQNLLRELQEKIHDIESVSQQRLKGLYMLGEKGNFTELVHLKDGAQFDRASTYIKHIRAFDLQLIEDLKILRIKRDNEKGKLTQLHNQQTELLAQLELQRQDLLSKAKARQDLIATLTAQKKELNTTLGALKAQALRLETVVRSLTGGEGEADATKTHKADEQVKVAGFAGQGFGDKDHIVAPFTGKLIQRFGRGRGADEVATPKGVEFAGSGGVVAISDGRVAYVGKMPQLGTIVIVDHGKRDYSLYGRLASTAVKAGELISKGEGIGEASPPDPKGRSFYFELRKGGSAVDPESVLGSRLGK